MGNRGSIGGSAAAGGTNYQSRVAAFFATRILLELNASPLWELPAACSLDFIRCESGAHVDDLLIGTSGNGFIYCQAKRKISLSEAEDSEFASVIDQFTRQYLEVGRPGPWNRPFESGRDRLVLVTSSESTGPVTTDFESVCRRAAHLSKGQTLLEAAQTESEKSALSRAKACIVRSWTVLKGVIPSDEEIRGLLATIYVQKLDVDNGETHETSARDSLRANILKVPTEADAAWRSLVSIFTDVSSDRLGLTRAQIQTKLSGLGLELHPVRSFQDEIRKLRAYSDRVFSSMARHSKMVVRGNDFKITREVLAEVGRTAETANLLVIGDPGAGKSGVLVDFVSGLRDAGRDYVFLTADRLGPCTAGGIRAELNLNRDLVEVLENWPGRAPAFLIVDALDVARAEPAAAALRRLISEVGQTSGRWKVVASVRKFDLKYSQELQRLFPRSTVGTSVDQQFQRVQHVNISLLSEAELMQIANGIPRLHEIYREANLKLKQLLLVPFNLNLMAELLDAGVASGALAPIQTQLELLESYWTARVIRNDGRRDARESLLRNICEKMARTGELRIPRESVANESNSETLHDVLQNGILSEWKKADGVAAGQDTITFSHHILFDYALERLLLRGASPGLKGRLIDLPELAVFARPSLTLHFQYLWSIDPSRRDFWALALAICLDATIPEIAKVICGVVAAELASVPADLQILLDRVNSVEADQRHGAEKTLGHVLGALHTVAAEKIISGAGDLWAWLLNSLAEKLRVETAYKVRATLCHLLDDSASLSANQAALLNQASIKLLEFSWNDTNLVTHAIQCVCKTYPADILRSRATLGKILQAERLSTHGYVELPALAGEISELIAADPEFSTEIYKAAFSFSEESRDAIPMGNSQILPLTTNPKQNYEMARYRLSWGFNELLNLDFLLATKAAAFAFDGFIVESRGKSRSGRAVSFFLWDGPHEVIEDSSSIWDEGTYHKDPAIEIVDEWEARFEELASYPENLEEIKGSILLLLDIARFAAPFRRILRIGCKYPDTLGVALAGCLSAKEILIHYDLSRVASDFVEIIHPILSTEERKKIEQAIIDIPAGFDAEKRESAVRVRARFARALQPSDIVIEEMRAIREKAITNFAGPVDGAWSEAEDRELNEDFYLVDSGVPLDEPQNIQIRQLEKPIRAFNDKHLNETPGIDEINGIFSHLEALNSAVLSAACQGVHQALLDGVALSLVRACAYIAKNPSLDCAWPVGALAREILIREATNPKPVASPEAEEGFRGAGMSAWGLYPRSESACGLARLSGKPLCCNAAVVQELERLALDPHPVVRNEVISRLHFLRDAHSEKMWELVELVVQREKNQGVQARLLVGPFAHLASKNLDRVYPLVSALYEHAGSGEGAKKLRELCVQFFTDQYVDNGSELCQKFVSSLISELELKCDEATCIPPLLRGAIVVGPISPVDPAKERTRSRAINLIRDLLTAANERLEELQAAKKGIAFELWPKEDQERGRALFSISENIGQQIYFASGAFQESRKTTTERHEILSIEQKQRFFTELSPVLEELTGAGFASVSHHVLETLEAFVEVEPKKVFLCMARAVEGGKKGGYQFESLAVDLIVRTVERYLAEHRDLFQELECSRALMSILNTFVEAGWPKARVLTYQLDEIFR